MKALESTLLAALASAGMNLAVAFPVALWALRKSSVRKRWLLALVALLNVLEWFVLMLPRYHWFAQWEWNWQGKLLEVAWPVLLVLLAPRLSLDGIGLRLRLEPAAWKGVLLAAGAALIFATFFLPRMGGSPDKETLLFELTMPGLGEELVFRGVFQSLLNEVLGRPWRLFGAQLGWGYVLTLLLFTTGHGLVLTPRFHLLFSLPAMFPALVLGPILGWVRERSGSVWPGMLIHNAVDTLPLLL